MNSLLRWPTNHKIHREPSVYFCFCSHDTWLSIRLEILYALTHFSALRWWKNVGLLISFWLSDTLMERLIPKWKMCFVLLSYWNISFPNSENYKKLIIQYYILYITSSNSVRILQLLSLWLILIWKPTFSIGGSCALIRSGVSNIKPTGQNRPNRIICYVWKLNRRH